MKRPRTIGGRGREPALPKWAREDRHSTLYVTGGAVALIGASMLARHFGASEVANGGALVIGLALLLSGQAALRLRAVGVTLGEAAAWSGALAIAMAAPPLAAVLPGRTVAEATLVSVGDVVRLPDGTHGAVHIVASSDLPETSSLQFALQVGRETLRGSLRRGTVKFVAGEQTRHFHEDRWSVALSGEIPRGPGGAILLADRTAQSPSLRIRVFQPVLPIWILRAGAILTGLACAIRWSRSEEAGGVVDTAVVGVLAGVLASWMVTPDAAVGATILGLLGGTMAGVPLGALIRAVAHRTARRRTGRAARAR